MTILWALIGIPAVIGVVLCLAGHRADRPAVALGVGSASICVVLAVLAAVRHPSVSVPFIAATPFGLAVDQLSGILVVTVTVVTLLVLVFAGAEQDTATARFQGLMLVFAAAVILTVTATTLPVLLIGWEVMGAMSYALIGFRWPEPERVSAGATAFLTTRAADVGLYAAAAAALAGGGGLALQDLASATAGWRHLIAAGVLVAALGKAAQLPFSFWLSRAMQGPSPVSALLHSAAMVAMGGYLLLRVTPLLEATGWAAPTAAWIGALTALLLGVVALAQSDLKQLLAASTAAQLGFVVAAAGLGAVAGGTAQLVAHAATKALLFLAAGAWLSALGTKQLVALRGVARRWPIVGVMAGVGLLSLAGVAPLSLWATKDEILAAAREQSPALYLVLLAAAALSAAYAGKVLVQVWRGPLETTGAGWDAEQPGTRRIGLLMRVPMSVLAVGAAVLGFLVLPPVRFQLRSWLSGTAEPTAGPLELLGSTVLALVVLGLVGMEDRWTGRGLPRWAADWLGLEPASKALVVRPVLALSRALARFDDRMLDRAVSGAATGVGSLARRLADIDDHVVDRGVGAAAAGVGSLAGRLARFDIGGVDATVEGLARQVRRAGALARRPQTGQLHQYYLQAVAVLAGGVLLLLVVRYS